ncbi:MAG: hypothetical protein AB7J19_03600 [Beijerinckiaceae bacterium]
MADPETLAEIERLAAGVQFLSGCAGGTEESLRLGEMMTRLTLISLRAKLYSDPATCQSVCEAISNAETRWSAETRRTGITEIH